MFKRRIKKYIKLSKRYNKYYQDSKFELIGILPQCNIACTDDCNILEEMKKVSLQLSEDGFLQFVHAFHIKPEDILIKNLTDSDILAVNYNGVVIFTLLVHKGSV